MADADASLKNRKPVISSWELAALVLALLFQISFFAVATYRNRGHYLQGDNTFYDTPARNFAAGHGLTIARSEFEDPYLTERFYKAHPDRAGDPYIPATVFAPGYCYFLAFVYSLFGPNELAAVLANGLLLIGNTLLTWNLARRAFGGGAGVIAALGLTASFPMWGYWSGLIMSDMLHVFLLSGFAVVWLVDDPGPIRGILGGALLAASALTRPYVYFLPLAFACAIPFFRLRAFSVRKVALLAAATYSCFGLWTLRNYYEFGTPIMVTSMGPGNSLWLAATFEDVPSNEEAYARMDLGDLHRHDASDKYMKVAKATIAADPGHYLWNCMRRVPRRWLSVGGVRDSLPSFTRIPFLSYQLALLFLAVVGVLRAVRTKNVVLAGSLVIVLYYTAVFFPLQVEARYTLPARSFSFLLAAPLLASFAPRRGTSQPTRAIEIPESAT